MTHRTAGTHLGMTSCPGSLIAHVDGTPAGCTEDHEPDGCPGLAARHEGEVKLCCEWYPDGCARCGIHGRANAPRA